MKRTILSLFVLSLMLTSFTTAAGDFQRGDVSHDGQVNVDDLTCLIDYLLKGTWFDEPVAPPDGHEYVDLGLPSGTLWATCNVGANAPEECGDYFAWGETEPKAVYEWGTYKWCNGSYKSMTKYCTSASYGTVDNKTALEPEDDAASVNWGASWRIPTNEQQHELVDNCTWTWTTSNGVNGYLVTGPNGNTLFLPATGAHRNESLYDFGSYGYYWSRTLTSGYSSGACYMSFQSEEVNWNKNCYRFYGYTVRAVYVPQMPASFTAADNEYQRGDVDQNGRVSIDDVTCLIDYLLKGTWPEEPEIPDNHEYVDLGLPSGTLWATCNVGADNPECYGDYYAWGETESKDVYNWGTYKWCNGSRNTLTKYNTNNNLGIVDNKTELDPEDDAAYVNWGPSWRTPTDEQLHELYDRCTWIRSNMNGVKGYKVKGPNGNMIFLPAAGFRNEGSIVESEVMGIYWSRSCATNNGIATGAYEATEVGFDWGEWTTFYNGVYGARYFGHSVRAVHVPLPDTRDLYVQEESLNLGDVLIDETITGELTIVNNTAGDKILTVSVDEPFMLKEDEGSASSIIVVVPGNSSREVTVMFSATRPGLVSGNVYFLHSSLEGGQTVVPVQARAYYEGAPQSVDLGLPSGTLWATCNIGANNPEEYGDYFAWGETEPKNYYDWSTYKWCNGTNRTLTKYCDNSSYGTVDYKTVLDLEDDAAYVNWGESWRMPTEEQMEELMVKCTWTWTTINGVKGNLVTGPNGNTIFLPAAGLRSNGSLTSVGTYGYYWTRTLITGDPYSGPDGACGLSSDSGNPAWSYTYRLRYFGQSIRPVRASKI